ncbi:MAG: T9SS type A sorting domain-containing protein [Ignavibacteriaceae bacterium]|nr:T9SS type A sorting domain-containing protein [Ignavibacteriaceae bacterium]
MKLSIYILKMSVIFSVLFLSIATAQTDEDSQKIWSVVKIKQDIKNEILPDKNWVPADQTSTLYYYTDDIITVGPNFRPKPGTNTTQSETSVDVHPTNNNIIFCSANSTNWPVTSLYGTGVYWSLNGGTNWTGYDNPPFGTNSGDPVSVIGADGRFYENYITNSYGLGVSVSTNNGTNWTTHTVAPNPGQLTDKNHYMVDKKSGSPYLNRSYCIWTDFGGANDGDAVFRYSTNYGQNWSSSINLSNSLSAFNQGVNIQTGPNGEVYATWAVYTGSFDREDGIGFAKSTNGGVTWSAPMYAYFQTNFGIRGTLSSKSGIRVSSFPSMAVDRSGGPYNGYIYITWPQKGVSPAGSDPDIVLIRSTNGGTNWSTPIRVNNDPLNNGKDQYYPWCTVDQATGQLMLVFYDSRNVVNSQAEVFMARSQNGGVAFENFKVSDQAHTPSPIPGLAGGYAGDYIGVAAYNNVAYPLWADNRTGNYQGWMAKVTFSEPVADPTNVFATPINGSQIDISFTPNGNNNNVVVVWNLTGTFTTPVGTPPVAGQPFAGGTILYNGTTSPINHTGLIQLTTYYYKAFSYDGSNYSPGVLTNATTLSALDFGVDLLVYDNCMNQVPLVFGTAPGATDCYDVGLDQSAPPPPPVGAFDGRFSSCGEHWFTDIRGTNTSGERIWSLLYTPASDCSPASFSWNPAQLPPTGYFHLVDPIYGNIVNVNMRTTNHYTDMTSLGLGQLQIKYNYQIQSKYNLAAGWNMLSLPVEVSNNNYLALFPTAVPGTLFGYSGAYFNTETIGNCGGYWLKFPSSQIAEVYGLDRTECVLNLNAGWNIIGGPNCNVPISSVLDPGGIIVPGTLYGYSGSYTQATSIDGTKAYWIKISSAGTLTISCNNVIAEQSNELSKLSEITEEFGKIEISDANENSQTIYFGGKLGGNVDKESYSMPPKAPEGSFDVRLMGDYRLSESDEVSIQIEATEFPLYVTVENLKIGEDYELVEISNGVEVGSHSIVDGEKIVITNEEVTMLKITKQQSLPTTYNLEQNYPNPFNPSTTIKFSLPEATNITLKIYNTLGEKVAELVNTNLEAGYYNYQWDAGNIASGIYIYELRTEKFIALKKMILIK